MTASAPTPASTSSTGTTDEPVAFRAWVLFGLAVAGGAVLGAGVGTVIMIVGALSSGDLTGLVGYLPLGLLFGGAIGTLLGVASGVGAFIAVMAFDRRLKRVLYQRALIAGAGAGAAAGICWLLLNPVALFTLFAREDPTLPVILSTAAVAWVSGALAASAVWFRERRYRAET